MKKATINLIKVYKRAFSGLWGQLPLVFPYSQCKFYPTCSDYAVDSVDKHGVIKGLAKSFWRILRCNPWSKGGIDED